MECLIVLMGPSAKTDCNSRFDDEFKSTDVQFGSKNTFKTESSSSKSLFETSKLLACQLHVQLVKRLKNQRIFWDLTFCFSCLQIGHWFLMCSSIDIRRPPSLSIFGYLAVLWECNLNWCWMLIARLVQLRMDGSLRGLSQVSRTG